MVVGVPANELYIWQTRDLQGDAADSSHPGGAICTGLQHHRLECCKESMCKARPVLSPSQGEPQQEWGPSTLVLLALIAPFAPLDHSVWGASKADVHSYDAVGFQLV